MTVRSDVQYLRQKPITASPATVRPSTAFFIPPFCYVGGPLQVGVSGRYYVGANIIITGVLLSGENGTAGNSIVDLKANDVLIGILTLPHDLSTSLLAGPINVAANSYLTVNSTSTANHTGIVLQINAILGN